MGNTVVKTTTTTSSAGAVKITSGSSVGEADPHGGNIEITAGDSYPFGVEVSGGSVFITGGKSAAGGGGDVNLNPGRTDTGTNGSIQIGVQVAPSSITIGNSAMVEPVTIGSSLFLGNRGRMLQIQTGKDEDFAGSCIFQPSDQGVKVIQNTGIKNGDMILFTPPEFVTVMAWPTYTISANESFTIRMRTSTGSTESNYSGLVSWFIVRPVVR